MAKTENGFSGEIGIHYPLHVLNRYLLPELIGLAETTWGTMGQFGFSQVWTRHRAAGDSSSAKNLQRKSRHRLRCVADAEAVDRLIIAGTPAQCKERIAELFSLAARDGFTQITLGVPLGPKIPEVIRLWGEEILPMLR